MQRLLILLPLLLLTLLTGCAISNANERDAYGMTKDDWKSYRENHTGVSIEAANHTDRFVYGFYVNGSYGSNVKQHGQGGNSCCVMLPNKWYPELTVTVEWRFSGEAPDKNGEDVYHKATVPVEKYDEAGTIYVHFFDDNKIRVVSSARYGAGSPRHPIPFTDFKSGNKS